MTIAASNSSLRRQMASAMQSLLPVTCSKSTSHLACVLAASSTMVWLMKSRACSSSSSSKSMLSLTPPRRKGAGKDVEELEFLGMVCTR
eukprot:CAMPEP_0202866312 /NCGR_PEP_ID=MMETSP1391-20130828/7316_1 /ASSEMBLY_ACC=CAM_ASM_000867 /TAXON_ID=1034604 /ORGANISM="Chlamydomonas leiostraca, Strain SAG 11-49" /LENGTH=88 /DNA_ID=CAMNT_0049546245 /DNA_START=271 /DNA_END=537 /DNA_ORIENTATION=-